MKTPRLFLLLLLVSGELYCQIDIVPILKKHESLDNISENVGLPMIKANVPIDGNTYSTFLFGFSWLYPYAATDDSSNLIINRTRPLRIKRGKDNVHFFQILSTNDTSGEIEKELPVSMTGDSLDVNIIFNTSSDTILFPIRFYFDLDEFFQPAIKFKRLYLYTLQPNQFNFDPGIRLVPYVDGWYLFKENNLLGRFGEVIKINEKYYKFSHANLLESTIQVEAIEGKSHLTGIREGQYLDTAYVLDQLNNILQDQNTIHYHKIMLHFWAEWCGPCRDHMPHIIDLEKRLRKSKTVKTIHLVSFFDENDLSKEKQYIDGQHFPFNTYCVPFNKRLTKYLKINEFPTYLIFNRKGKILLRSSKIDEVEKVLGY